MLIISVILILILSLLIIEKRMLQKSIASMSLRIHVNGTRGKSSVTEYVAAGIASAGHDVMAKITGIIPSTIHNGVTETVDRAGPARVQEQVNILRSAFRKRVRTMVMECMSIAPELQKLEGSIFKPHFYVITNIRDDHREEMGKDLESQAEAICSAIPANCRVITGERTFINKIKEKASAGNSTVVTAGELEERLRERLPYGIFPENVALALTVCREAGIDPEKAETGIMNWIASTKSPLKTINDGGKKIRFLNAFAVNDIDSTESFIGHWMEDSGHSGRISVILNTRADRPVRTDLFSEWIAKNPGSFDRIIVTGSHRKRAQHKLSAAGFEKGKVICWNRREMHNPVKSLVSTVADGSFVTGIGNIGGEGFHIINELR
ncbi:MAG: poly-gamma-glutamate synthase PgsB [Bacteroidales bacterium]|nr:poly-gamma-glutamate synthase PgsB [Bacteroidales bacterium]MDT8372606.1 poly-gamma-glutamate synthase PgsB [Bacteroidales bacterium]